MFPVSFSTTQNPLLVTNNLYLRKTQRAEWGICAQELSSSSPRSSDFATRNPKLTLYSTIFYVQVIAAQYFAQENRDFSVKGYKKIEDSISTTKTLRTPNPSQSMTDPKNSRGHTNQHHLML
jgi:hypothetical protein